MEKERVDDSLIHLAQRDWTRNRRSRNIPATLLAPADSSPADRDDDRALEDLEPPSRHRAFIAITDRVQDAMDFIVALSLPIRVDEAPLNHDQILARNLRLKDTCKVFAELLASSAEQAKTDK